MLAQYFVMRMQRIGGVEMSKEAKECAVCHVLYLPGVMICNL
jgi:hypothetical protein